MAASPDGSIWVLSILGGPLDKLIYHYQNGVWTNIPGAAMRLAVGPDGTLWAVNSLGGIYSYKNGVWTGIAGGASDIAAASDGSIYVISSVPGGIYGNGIYHYKNGTWTQLPGAGTRIAASWDTGSYSYNVAPGGFYVVNSQLSLFYYNPTLGFTQIPGAAVQLAPTTNGGLFVLGIPNSVVGYPIYYNDLVSGTWTQQTGAGIAIATNTSNVYVIGATNGIYQAPVTVAGPVGAGNGTKLTGPSFSPNNAGAAWAPTSVANALNFPVQSGWNGTGQTVAIVIDSNVAGSDIGNYMTYNQTPATSRQITYELINSATATPDGGNGQGEATLDVETVAGLAPGANIIIYVMAQLNNQNAIDAYNQVIADNKARIVSSSFAGCEQTGNGDSGESTVIAQAAAKAIAFIASTGDQGNECFNGIGEQPGVGYPASDPNAIGVGGNETYKGQFLLTSTVAWNDNDTGNGSQEASGGGVSTEFPLPPFQVGLPGAASSSFRNVPDLSMPAVYDGIYQAGSAGSVGGWGVVNGTSWAAPMFAAMLSEVYEYCNAAFYTAIDVPYYVFGKGGYSAYIDVSSGNNQYQGTGPAYSAHAGYDNATGIGVPLGMPFAQTICPNRVPAFTGRNPGLASVAATRRAAQAYSADVVPHVRGLVDRGRQAASTPTRIQLVLQAGATLATDEQTVIGVLQAAGLTIVKTFSNHLVVDAEGPSSVVEQLFGTQIHTVSQGQYGVHYAPIAPATVPASLAPYVAGFSLDDVITMKHR